MEVPPVYANAPKRKSKVPLIIGIVVACLCVCCGLPVVGFYKIFGQAKPLLTCVSSFKTVASGIRKYATEHEGKLPKAETWQDDVKEAYRQSMHSEPDNPFTSDMPADGEWSCIDGDGHRTGISYNAALSGKKLDSVGDEVSTILLFETDRTGHNLQSKYVQQAFNASPKSVLGKQRGWIVANVAGETGLINERGMFVPVNMSGGKQPGFNVNVETSSGHPVDDGQTTPPPPGKPAKPSKPGAGGKPTDDGD